MWTINNNSCQPVYQLGFFLNFCSNFSQVALVHPVGLVKLVELPIDDVHDNNNPVIHQYNSEFPDRFPGDNAQSLQIPRWSEAHGQYPDWSLSNIQG